MLISPAQITNEVLAATQFPQNVDEPSCQGIGIDANGDTLGRFRMLPFPQMRVQLSAQGDDLARVAQH
ncbi:hypothetical protein KZ287_33020, partial [Escherichia coli]|nr:hypothetical protein [Escherichia coli]